MKKTTLYFGGLVFAASLSFATHTNALTLGRLSVLSFLGQPLIAEIEVPDISPEEANSLRVLIANPETFKSAGLEYTSAVAELKIAGKRRADGRAILEVRGSQPITAPFIDLVLEVIWNSGRVLRDYTVLLETPAVANQAAPILAPTLPMLTPSQFATANTPPPTSVVSGLQSPAPDAAVTTQAVPAPSDVNFSVRTEVANAPVPRSRASVAAIKAPRSTKDGLRTKKGDTAVTLASTNQLQGISLDQLLVAMLRGNPQAFIDGNVNRLKSGVVVTMPTLQDAQSISALDAKNSIQAQARDFNDYRRKLAHNAGASEDKESNQQASGKVAAKVQDRQAPVTTDGRLTLAKPSPAAQQAATAEDAIAKNRAALDAAQRSAELNKNISELTQLSPSPESRVSSTAPVAAAPSPVATASTPVRPALPRPAVIPQPEVSLVDQVIDNPLTLPLAGASGVALLLGALFNARRKRARALATAQDSSITFSHTQQPQHADTVFGPMGANDVNTKEMSTGAGMTYSPPSTVAPSTTSDVDPIAEADVYLAYNRDVQAEEILKEAKRNTPNRTDIQVKLLEIYTKRQDKDAFNLAAQDLHLLTDGEGNDWAQARVFAREIGSTHVLFQAPASAFAAPESTPLPQSSAYQNPSLSFVPAAAPAAMPAPVSAPTSAPAGAGLIDFDLSSLSLDLPNHAASVASSNASAAQEDAKLALAEEYLSIGDKPGARSLIEEVLQFNSNPHVVALAQQMLARIG